ncbi:hypothetical protein GCM10010983_42800 [Caulobacter rhizosphaerae]|nr:hypothetical protein GCM10010983_42800 [Caulobacter rhizosphaerae]
MMRLAHWTLSRPRRAPGWVRVAVVSFVKSARTLVRQMIEIGMADSRGRGLEAAAAGGAATVSLNQPRARLITFQD